MSQTTASTRQLIINDSPVKNRQGLASDSGANILTANTAPTFLFDGDGTVTTDFGSDEWGNSVTVQADGKILLGGISDNESKWDFALVRYNADGSLDTSFGGDGIVTADFGRDDWGYSVTVQADGKILLGGTSYNESNSDFTLVRYNTDGSLDTRFGGDGKVTTDFGSDESGSSVTVQADGKILLGGDSDNGSTDDFALVRYNTDGSLDKSFGGDGEVTTDFGIDEWGSSVTVQTDGKILLGGGSSSNGSNHDFALVRYNSNGSLDKSFGGDGKVTTDFGSSDQGYSVTVQADGKILLGGFSDNGSNYDFALVRYNADGSLDTSFGGDGEVTTDFGRDDWGYSVTVQADGKILLGGSVDFDRFALARYNADGSLDKSFGGDGKVTFGSSAEGSSVTVQANGKILLGGGSFNGSNQDFALVRYNTDGTLDSTFGGVNTLNGNPNYTENRAAIVLDNSVQIYDVELSDRDNYNGAAITLARHGGADNQDVFSGSGHLSLSVSNAQLSGITIGTVSNLNGTLTIHFNGNATQARVSEVLSSLAYSNTSDNPPASVPIDWTFSDGNTGKQGTGGALTALRSTTVNISPINDAPTLTAFTSSVATGNEDSAINVSFADLIKQANEADVDGTVTAFVIKSVSSGTLKFGASPGTAKPWNAVTNNILDATHQAYWTPSSNANGVLSAFTAVAVDNDGLKSATAIQATVAVKAVNDAPVFKTPSVINYTDTVFDDSFATVTRKLVAADPESSSLSYGIVGGTNNGNGVISKSSLYGVLTVVKLTGAYSFVANDAAIEALKATAGVGFTVTASDGSLSDSILLVIKLTQKGTTESLGNDTLKGTPAHDKFDGLAGNDFINGLAGADTMKGGLGNDTYTVENTGDVVIETSSLASEIDSVNSSISYTLKNNVENLTLTGTAAINGTGNALNNILTGNRGANNLNGGAGADKMMGGLGNDFYVVDNIGDVVIETSALATEMDTVKSSVTYAIKNNVENLTLTGTAAINGTGNTLNNLLTGNAGANTLAGLAGDDVLTGLAGADTMIGGLGNDTYVVDNIGDVVTEYSALTTEIDSVNSSVSYTLKANVEKLTLTGTAAINGTGNALNNVLTGNTGANILNGLAGNDIIDGLAGADTMAGGTGNDVYFVDNKGDVVTEFSTLATEIDKVNSAVSYTLTANVENLVLTGTAAINGTGNALDNVLTGNAVANTLNGGIGADMLIGGSGNDVYVVDNVADIVSETSAAASEIDRVDSSVSYILKANVENLTLTGTAAINGTGNTLANIITGNAGNNLLVGYEGSDTLNGGSGNDILNGVTGRDVLTGGTGFDAFRFSVAPTVDNTDVITDFVVADDTIQLENAVFTQFISTGTLNAGNFVESDVALDLDDYVIYNPGTGALMYDADGNNTGAAVLIAMLGTNLALTHGDIVVI